MFFWFSTFCPVYSRIFPEGKDGTAKHTNCVDLQMGLTKCSADREEEIGSDFILSGIK